jgi:hypothetical protein
MTWKNSLTHLEMFQLEVFELYNSALIGTLLEKTRRVLCILMESLSCHANCVAKTISKREKSSESKDD